MKQTPILKVPLDETTSIGQTVSLVMDVIKHFALKHGVSSISEETLEKSLVLFFVKRLKTRLEKLEVCVVEDCRIILSESYTGRLKAKLEFYFEYNCGECKTCKK